jgi:hypothetical protein
LWTKKLIYFIRFMIKNKFMTVNENTKNKLMFYIAILYHSSLLCFLFEKKKKHDKNL